MFARIGPTVIGRFVGLGAVTTVWVPWRRGDLFLHVVAIVGGPAGASVLAALGSPARAAALARLGVGVSAGLVGRVITKKEVCIIERVYFVCVNSSGITR